LEVRQLLLLGEQRPAGDEPLVARDDAIHRHGVTSSCAQAAVSSPFSRRARFGPLRPPKRVASKAKSPPVEVAPTRAKVAVEMHAGHMRCPPSCARRMEGAQ